MSKKEVDERHIIFRGLMFRCYQYLNKIDPPWDGSDAKQLDLLLKAIPKLTEQQFHNWLINYAKSHNINPAARPRVYLPNISNYASGPLDKFGRPISGVSRVLQQSESPREKLRKQLGNSAHVEK